MQTQTWIRFGKLLARCALAAVFVGSGGLHLLRPDFYMPLMPEPIPAPRFWIIFSGLAEIAGGLGLLQPALRRAAGLGLIFMLLGFFWVHIDMLLDPPIINGNPLPRWLMWLRLPLQFVLIAWAGWVADLWLSRPSTLPRTI